MTYEKHIEALNSINDDCWPGRPELPEALTAAIDALKFRQAAEPKDAEAEREHCENAVDKLMGRDDDPLLATGTRSMWASLVERERAAARAQGRMAMRMVGIPEFDWMGRANQAEQELAAAKAEVRESATLLHSKIVELVEAQSEIERLRAELAETSEVYEARSALETKVTNLRAVRDNLALMHSTCGAERITAEEERASLETKLTNLRKAAERMLGGWRNVKHRDALRAAVEKSR